MDLEQRIEEINRVPILGTYLFTKNAIRFSAGALAWLMMLGCASTPYTSAEVSKDQSTLANARDEEGEDTIRYSFERCDGRQLDGLLSLDAYKGTGYRIPPGSHRLGVSIKRSPKGFLAQHAPNVGRAVTTVAVQAGHRYRVAGRYIPREMTGLYRIVDIDTGDPAGEEFSMGFNPIAPDWNIFEIMPIPVKRR